MEAFKVNMSRFSIIMLLSSGILLGVMYARLLPREQVEILYVSQEELLDLENARVRAFKDLEGKELFGGKAAKAAEIVEEEAEKYGSRNRKVVFSVGKVYGANVRSISKEIYLEVIAELEIDTAKVKSLEE